MTNKVLYPLIATGAILLGSVSGLKAQQSTQEAISIGSDDIGGVVASNGGPEAGVWVIAETADLQTKFVKIVVTDVRQYGPQCGTMKTSRVPEAAPVMKVVLLGRVIRQ